MPSLQNVTYLSLFLYKWLTVTPFLNLQVDLEVLTHFLNSRCCLLHFISSHLTQIKKFKIKTPRTL